MKLRYTPGGRRSAWGSRTVVASVTGTGCLFLLAAAAHSQNARSAAPAPPRPAAPAAPAPDGVGTALALDSRQDPRLARELSVTARAAETSQFVAALGGSSGVRLRLGGGLTGRRITLHSERANLQSLQLALASLYHAQWRRESAATEAEYTLEPDPTLGDRVAVLRTERRARLVDALLKAEHAWRTQSGAALGGRLRREVAARLPDLPDEAIASLDANFLEQLGLVAPLRLRMGNTLVQSGSAWSPFRSLLARYQAMFAGFFAAETGSPAVVVAGGLPTAVGAAAAPPNLAPLTLPHARVEYKLLYGDRWTGPMLMVRVGVPDLWATSLLPSSLFAGTEDISLYGDVGPRPSFLRQHVPVPIKIDPLTQTWDQALETVARAARLNVVSDSHHRPHVFRAGGGTAPILTASTAGELLDRMTRYYGYAWWQVGDFLVFRHRMWGEEERVDIPEPVLQAISADAARGERLSATTVATLGTLTDEQLLTMQLYGGAAGRAAAAVEPFDYNEVQLLRTALTMFVQAPPEQREMIRADGLPFTAMPADLQRIFLAVAAERNMPLNALSQDRWRFHLRDEISRQRLDAGWSAPGKLTFSFDYGPVGVRRVELAVRAPVPGVAGGQKDGNR